MRWTKHMRELAIVGTIVVLVLMWGALSGSMDVAVAVLLFLFLFYAYSADPTRGCSIQTMEKDLRECEETATKLREAIAQAKDEQRRR